MTAPIDLTGRVSLVTGATGGIGQVVATELARLGSTVVIVCRDAAAGNELRPGSRQPSARTASRCSPAISP
jgi:NAD(P)-dependent dehydrogenase (short-subunit alcohol dehydrogenase family)